MKLQITEVNINDLKPAEYNPRQASEKEYADLKKSIENFGLVDPIIANSFPDRYNTIIGGHFRLKVAKDMGFKQMPVTYINIPEIERERELNIRLNKNLGSFDFDLLANFDEDLLKDIGFESKELDKIFQLEPDKDADEVPEVRETDVKLGDIYVLGTHRLMCGDATKREDVERLMNGQKADMVFTDPPYGVSYQSNRKNIKFGKIQNDDLNIAEFASFLSNVFLHYKQFTKEGSAIYVCHADAKPMIRATFEMNFNNYFKQSATIIWVKNVASMGYQHYRSQHEPILYGWNEDRSQFYGDRRQTTIWEVKRESNYKHPTQKPIELIERAINNSAKREDIVLDFFGGSGSTLIACERLNRKCYMLEIDPIYIQVIIDRWEKYTGGKAING